MISQERAAKYDEMTGLWKRLAEVLESLGPVKVISVNFGRDDDFRLVWGKRNGAWSINVFRKGDGETVPIEQTTITIRAEAASVAGKLVQAVKESIEETGPKVDAAIVHLRAAVDGISEQPERPRSLNDI